MDNRPVIYFDGVCNLCTGSVQFILKRDRKNLFRFASLQGEAGKQLLAKHGLPSDSYKTLILETEGKTYSRSTAALKISRHLSGLWPVMYILIVIPPFVRNFFYDIISANRYRWFGKKEACWLPRPEWENKFLD